MSEFNTLIYEGARLSQGIQLACTTLLLYDHVTNLAGEVEHFWTGPWTFSRIIYLCVRYLGFTQAVVSILGNNGLLPSLPYTLLTYSIAMASIPICQITITIRVYYMFARSLVIKSIAIGAYIASTLVSAVLTGMLWPDVRKWIYQPDVDRTSTLVWVFVPSMLFHSLLFALKVYRLVMVPRSLQTDTLLWRFLKEGMVMYACAIGSLLFIVIGLTKTDTSEIPVYEAAFSGGIIFVTFTIVSVCHAMLSIKSLAATLHVDPGWLLSHAELSRVHWRRGSTDGEIVVEAFDLPIMSPGTGKDVDSTLSMDKVVASGTPGENSVLLD